MRKKWQTITLSDKQGFLALSEKGRSTGKPSNGSRRTTFILSENC